MKMTFISDSIQRGMGWCPKAQMIKTAPLVLSMPPAQVLSPGPDGGAGRSGRIHRGTRIITDSIGTLVRNREILWFSVLTGLVIAFMFIAEYFLHILTLSYPYEMIGSPIQALATFCIELVSMLCLGYLLAALMLSRASETRGGSMGSIRRGLLQAKDHLRPILIWSGIMAIPGTAIYFLTRYADPGNLMVNGLINRFPFDYIVEPEAHGIGPIAGGFHILFASDSTFLLMSINVVLIILTLFVIPVLVLEKTALSGALGESFRLIKKSWGEILVCFFILGIAFIAFTLLSGIFQIVFSAVSLNGYFWYEFYYKGGWGLVAGVYMIAWMTLVLTGAALAGIAIQSLYQYAKTGVIPATP
jgi:hypothetical protein